MANDKNIDLYLTARDLSAATSRLRLNSRRLFFLQLFAMLLPFFLYCLLMVLASVFDVESLETLALVVFYLSFFVCLIRGMRLYYHLKSFYTEVKDRCGFLSDSIDWTIMRKKQVFGQLDDKIQLPIDAFYEYSSSSICPFYGGKARFTWGNILLFVIFLWVTVTALLRLFGVIDLF